MLRTHTCGELRLTDDKKVVTLCGWNQSRRDHGGIIFIDMRDRYGLTQIVFDPSHAKDIHLKAEHLKREDVLKITGHVRPRGPNLENPKMITGQIEILVDYLEIINSSETPPLEIDDHKIASDEARQKFRYLDLRRPIMQKRFLLRSNALQAVREFFVKHDFMEVETPLLIRSTPEGARDYVVPSRVHPGHFYALPQSPQIYKQILMIAGFDRYFQLAKCLRDEDLRTDRQPEFTQIDLEMSFVEEKDIFHLIENMLKHLFSKVLNQEITIPFKKLTYAESMEKYGIDKPDLRFGLELINFTEDMKECSFTVFSNMATSGGLVKCLPIPLDLSRKEIDELTSFIAEFGGKGLAWMKCNDNGLESSVTKFFSKELLASIQAKSQAKSGHTLLFVADKPKIVNECLARLRNKIAKDHKLYNEKDFAFCWIIDFPLFERNEEENSWDAMHHLFCMPKKEHIPFLDSDPGRVLASQYDIVLNGLEMGSGSLRITNPELQEKVMNVVGYSTEKAHQRFGFLLEAYKYGGPSHGGIALGFDRLVAVMQGLEDIREVIAFPRTKTAECLMDGSPSLLGEKELKELHLKVEIGKK